jgi:cytoskeletal protein RodZ
MKLDRNNYEEYFLMYADGELAAADRQAVEHFVKLHPDLGDELEMLMEAVLDIDANITMPNKASLYKTIEWQEETLTPQQKDLLLYVDNELPASQKLALESELKKDKALQSDLASLAKTKLPAEAVEMPEKEELYRKENNRKPIPIMVMRWMAAAAVIAGLGWFSLSVFTAQTKTDEPVVASNSEKAQSPKTPAGKSTNTPASQNPVLEDSPTTTTAQQVQPDVTGVNANPVAMEPKVKAAKAGEDKANSQPVRKAVSPKDNAIEPLEIASNKALDATPEKVIPTTAAVVNTNEVSNPLAELAAKHNVVPNTSTTGTGTGIASLTPSKDEITEEPEYVNIAGARIKKQKVRGLFRSVTRTVGRAFDKSNVAQADVATLK